MTLSEKQKQLSAQPRPRAVRMSKRGRSWTFLLGGVLTVIELSLIAHLYFGWARTSSVNGVLSRSGFTFYLLLLLPLLPIPFYRGLLKQRELLRNGEVAVATITSTSGPSSTPNRNDDVRLVEYHFRDRSGDIITGSTVDPTFLLRTGSAMLVYYDPENGDDQVAQCASYFEVVGVPHDWIEQIG